MNKPKVETFYHDPTNTFSYVVHGESDAVIIDPVLDFDNRSGRTSTEFADRIIAFVRAHGLTVHWLLETHAHADHLTSAHYLRRQLGGKTAIGEGICSVQQTFKTIFNAQDLVADGSQFDRLFRDGDIFEFGELSGHVWHTPGHTNDSVSYVIGDAAFVGDTLFAPHRGTARADFPGGDAHELFRSIHRLFSLPDDTRIFLCHDYPANGSAAEYVHELRLQRANNIHIRETVTENDYVQMRLARDATLSMPALIIPAVQVNMRAGAFPPAEDNGIVYLKLPVDRLGHTAD